MTGPVLDALVVEPDHPALFDLKHLLTQYDIQLGNDEAAIEILLPLLEEQPENAEIKSTLSSAREKAAK